MLIEIVYLKSASSTLLFGENVRDALAGTEAMRSFNYEEVRSDPSMRAYPLASTLSRTMTSAEHEEGLHELSTVDVDSHFMYLRQSAEQTVANERFRIGSARVTHSEPMNASPITGTQKSPQTFFQQNSQPGAQFMAEVESLQRRREVENVYTPLKSEAESLAHVSGNGMAAFLSRPDFKASTISDMIYTPSVDNDSAISNVNFTDGRQSCDLPLAVNKHVIEDEITRMRLERDEKLMQEETLLRVLREEEEKISAHRKEEELRRKEEAEDLLRVEARLRVQHEEEALRRVEEENERLRVLELERARLLIRARVEEEERELAAEKLRAEAVANERKRLELIRQKDMEDMRIQAVEKERERVANENNARIEKDRVQAEIARSQADEDERRTREEAQIVDEELRRRTEDANIAELERGRATDASERKRLEDKLEFERRKAIIRAKRGLRASVDSDDVTSSVESLRVSTSLSQAPSMFSKYISAQVRRI
jgi:hypothetical protein